MYCSVAILFFLSVKVQDKRITKLNFETRMMTKWLYGMGGKGCGRDGLNMLLLILENDSTSYVLFISHQNGRTPS